MLLVPMVHKDLQDPTVDKDSKVLQEEQVLKVHKEHKDQLVHHQIEESSQISHLLQKHSSRLTGLKV